MNAIVKRLGTKLRTTQGGFRYGAVTRASEHLGISRTTIRNWFLQPEIWSPGKATLAKIEDMLGAKVDFSARKSGPKGPRNQALANNRAVAAK